MRARLLLSYLSITLLVLLALEIPLGLSYANDERGRLTNGLERDAFIVGNRVEEALEDNDAQSLSDARSLAAKYQRDTGARVVIINGKGQSIADSEPLSGESADRDFTTRPEIKQALAGHEATGSRYSESLHADLIYAAVPITTGNKVIGAVRISYTSSYLDARVKHHWLLLLAIAAIVLAVVFLVSLWLARGVTRPLGELEDAAGRLGGGDLGARVPDISGPQEIQSLRQSFNATAARLETLVTGQRAFVADASHQLRTPLAALRLRLENLAAELDEAPDGDERADAIGALDEVERLTRLVDGLLTLARAEDAGANPVKTELLPVVMSRVDAWSAFADEQDIGFSVAVPEALTVRVTPGRLEQALDNIMSNAVAAAPPHTMVTVAAVTRPGGDVELIIRDHGSGMTEEQRVHAFDRFWRASSASRGGFGLGLAIAQQLLVSDGGTLALRPAEHGGLEVVFVLEGEGRRRDGGR
jgi:signal transduction histidine kinase